ncbi:Aldehyde-lyase domain-containing protein [Artemisia annua]|uniref:Aldehyde-lyase domain-containing protein n=1 Tax=Artemisia annua TaxID=35608 RepID=A0A2U1P5D6_ARTAN|nr:Aldehyde-lyase domain-containing protein [Artemisia annua]
MMRTMEKGLLKMTGKGKDKDGGGGAYLGGIATPFDTPGDMRPRGYHDFRGTGYSGIYYALACLCALSAAQTSAIIRIPNPEPLWVKKSLDIGPQGIMFPMIESRKMAKKVVSYCRYPLNGIWVGAHHVVRASGYGIDTGI